MVSHKVGLRGFSFKAVRSFLYMGLIGLVACSTGHCRRDGTRVVDRNFARPSGYVPPKEVSIRVAKPDGSKQCGFAAGLSLEAMAQEQLSEVPVLSSEKLSDGMMHTASCGSSTGMMNVYEIPESGFEKAKTMGFRIFKR